MNAFFLIPPCTVAVIFSLIIAIKMKDDLQTFTNFHGTVIFWPADTARIVGFLRYGSCTRQVSSVASRFVR